jgi:hypothetical protein
MPTSGVTSWERTAGDVVKSAMVELGVISAEDEPEASEYDEALVRLNGLLKFLATKGAMYREDSGTLTIAGGTGAATLPVTIRDVSSARHIVSSTYQRLLMPWNRAQYYALPNRSQAGANPTIYMTQKTIAGLELRVWPVPAADITLNLDYSRSAEVVTAPDEALDIPQDWQDAITMLLASRCASMFGTDRVSPSSVQRIDGMADSMLNQLLDADRPDSYYFEPWNA